MLDKMTLAEFGLVSELNKSLASLSPASITFQNQQALSKAAQMTIST
jgi:hypothetical protein